jgi:5,6-dimethylbenzimidazole synthase
VRFFHSTRLSARRCIIPCRRRRYSTVCAIHNLWLAARSEGVGVGWVSILDPEKVRQLLNIPDHLVIVAYLCLGYVDRFSSEPDLERFGWEKRVALNTVVSYEQYSEADEL